MSGDHNMYCSGNQPDIVERLRMYDSERREMKRKVGGDSTAMQGDLLTANASFTGLPKAGLRGSDS